MSTSICLFCVVFLASVVAGSTGTQAEYQTDIKLYFHEIVTGPNKTSFIVAGPNLTSHVFGDIVIFDNALREGPDPESRLVGRAQGTSILASQSDPSVLTAINFVLTDHRRYNGSTIAVLGRVPASGTAERTVVGGTGMFRMARGYVISTVVNATTDAYVIEFSFHLLHY